MRLETREEAIIRLEAEQRGSQDRLKGKPRKLPIDQIHDEPLVFQVRSAGLAGLAVKQIKKGLQGNSQDDPLHVMRIGERWVVLEGHHRLAAYRQKQAETQTKIMAPVVAHSGLSILEGIGLAARQNSRSKHSITQAERLDAAWTMVVLGKGSIAQQAQSSGASESTIDNMRKVKKELSLTSIPSNTLIEAGWSQSREWARGKRRSEFCLDAQEALALEWSELIGKATKGQATKNPEALARAIFYISPELPERLLGTVVFEDTLWEYVAELADEEKHSRPFNSGDQVEVCDDNSDDF